MFDLSHDWYMCHFPFAPRLLTGRKINTEEDAVEVSDINIPCFVLPVTI